MNKPINAPATKQVLSSQLRAGDILQIAGVRVRLTEQYKTYREGSVGWRSEYVGCVDPDQTPEAMHGPYFGGEFRRGWAVQGNDLASWAREV